MENRPSITQMQKLVQTLMLLLQNQNFWQSIMINNNLSDKFIDINKSTFSGKYNNLSSILE